MPCSGPRGPFSWRSLSSASAMASASGLISMTELIAGPRLSISLMRVEIFSRDGARGVFARLHPSL